MCPIDVGLVGALLERHYHLTGRLRPVPTEKDDTFRLGTSRKEYLVKVSPPDEAEDWSSGCRLPRCASSKRAAPELPVQRVRLTADGRDNVVVPTDDGRARVLRVFEFVQGAVWAQADPTPEQVGEGRCDARPGRRGARGLRTPCGPARAGVEPSALPRARRADRAHPEPPSTASWPKGSSGCSRSAVVPELAELETQVIHGDYSPYNVVVDEAAATATSPGSSTSATPCAAP